MRKTSRVSRVSSIPLFILAGAMGVSGVARAQTFSVLHTFQYFPHGAAPFAPLYRDPQGNIYGTTYGGGPYNAGVVYKLNSAGSQTVLHTFTGGTDGGNPTAGLTADSAGNLYGTTWQGGIAGAGANHLGAGVVYKIDTSGHFEVLYSFTGGVDGSGPFAGVILDSVGNLYGTTYYGGVSQYGTSYGVVYKLSPLGQETVLYSFKGAPDGANPFAGVTADTAGNLYGTTYGGGLHTLGTVYKLTASGQETVVYNFGGSTLGADPSSGVVLDAAGNMYGAAGSVAYKLDPAGGFTELKYFGPDTLSGLTRDSAGNLYITSNAVVVGRWPMAQC